MYGCEGVCRVIWGLNQLDRFYQVKILKWVRLPKGFLSADQQRRIISFFELYLFDLQVYNCQDLNCFIFYLQRSGDSVCTINILVSSSCFLYIVISCIWITVHVCLTCTDPWQSVKVHWGLLVTESACCKGQLYTMVVYDQRVDNVKPSSLQLVKLPVNPLV